MTCMHKGIILCFQPLPFVTIPSTPQPHPSNNSASSSCLEPTTDLQCSLHECTSYRKFTHNACVLLLVRTRGRNSIFFFFHSHTTIRFFFLFLPFVHPATIPIRTLSVMKQKLKGAQTGHSLLKRKSEALTKRFRDIVKKIDDVCGVSPIFYGGH